MPKKMMRIALSSELLTQIFSEAIGEDVRVIHVSYDIQSDSVQIVFDGIGNEVAEGCEIPIKMITSIDMDRIQQKLKDILSDNLLGSFL